jgi:Tol biopolymer transport system component
MEIPPSDWRRAVARRLQLFFGRPPRVVGGLDSIGPLRSFDRLTTSSHTEWPTAVSPDGKFLAYTQTTSRNDADVWILPLEGERTPRVFVQSPFWEDSASFSPDGRFLAFNSDESGRPQVYVQAFPGPGSRRQVSADGGRLPVWSRDGREIYFRNGDKLMAAAVLSGPNFATGKALELLAAPFMQPWYDVTRDGRFLMIRWSEEERNSQKLNLVFDWPALLPRARSAP